MMKNKAGWVALIVLAIATLLMIFFVMPNLSGIKDDVTANAPSLDTEKPADGAAADAKGDRPATEAVEAAADAAKPDPQPSETAAGATPDAQPSETAAGAKPADPAAAWVVPGFDVLRVEPDGSTVIAGRAQPGTTLEIVNGETVVGTADVGSTGDFAAVFDEPLPPGDYQLTLRSVDEGGASKGSDEVATVSIPRDKAGDLLAMVSKPGEASRIITTPETRQPAAATTGEPADATGADGAGADTAATAPAGNAAATTTTGSDTPAAAASGDTPADAANTTPDVAAATPQTGETAGAPATAAGPSEVSVSAVEIEGRKIFVAGKARPGALVRIYADDRLVGEIRADGEGRFVVEGTLDLAVGRHTIRADMMGDDGRTVAFRAAVPFDRPAGEQIAAVALPDAAGTMAAFDGGSFDGLRAEATKAFGLLKGLFADGRMPGGEELAAARSSTEIALASLAGFKITGTLDPGIADMVRKTATSAAEALALLKALPQDAASVFAALGSIETAIGQTLMPRTDGTGGTADGAGAPAPAGTQDSVPVPAVTQGETPDQSAAGSIEPAAQTEATGSQTAAGPETVEQAPLTQSKTSIIIRRGDTLWQISRRVYGQGVRYTTIYLANEDQITDPDRIVPGQIFGVPDQALPDADAEEIHRKRLTTTP